MHQSSIRCSTRASAVTLLTLGALAAPALATPSIRNAFTAKYPTSTLLNRTSSATGSVCYACHQPPNTSAVGNCYKNALAARIAAGRTPAQAINDIDALDSDGDGIPNGVEILAVRTDLPGQVGYNPGLVGATGTDPCGANPATPVTNQRETQLPSACNPADICGAGATYDNGAVDIGPDKQLTIEDFLNFLSAFGDATGCPGTGPCNPADICGAGATYDNGAVDIGPDGDLTIEDFLNFLSAFGDATGCP